MGGFIAGVQYTDNCISTLLTLVNDLPYLVGTCMCVIPRTFLGQDRFCKSYTRHMKISSKFMVLLYFYHECFQ